MESASRTQGMPLPQNLRPKQIEIINACQASPQVIAKLPTGYGKTRAGVGAYAVRRHAGSANRLLWLVPRDGQANQAAEDIPHDLVRDYGIESKSIIVGANPIQALRAHRESRCEVFIATVQSLMSDRSFSTFQDLMSTGRWFLIVDEHHHFGNGKAWANRVKMLPAVAQLAMSATPRRPDAADYFPEPSIIETYYNAAKTRCVKRLSLHAYEYSVDAMTVDGEVIRFSTSDLVEQAGGEAPEQIDEFMARRKMKWSPKYISPLVQFPFDRLTDLRVNGVRSQMLIQTMSCAHAQMVCKQVEALLQDRAAVDWVGTGPFGRSNAENKAVLRRFCPPKDRTTDRREWNLDVLVNVGMAGEGLDTTDVTEVVFLTQANLTNTNLQTIGRGARVMHTERDVVCHVNVDTDSEMGKYVGPRVMELFDEGVAVDERDEEDEGKSRDYKEMPDEMQVVIVDVRLTDIKQEPMYQTVLAANRAKNLAAGMDEDLAERLSLKHAEQAIREYLSRGNNQSAVIAQERQQVHAAVGKIVTLCMRHIAESGVRPERTMAGDFHRRLRGKLKSIFGPIDAADEEVLKQQYGWLKKLERQILLEHGLRGAPRWLL